VKIKILTGGQTGADQGALAGAVDFTASLRCTLDVETGGWAPRGCKTEIGEQPELVRLYGLVEHESDEYPPRNKANVRDCDFLLAFQNHKSDGTDLSIREAKRLNKPCTIIKVARIGVDKLQVYLPEDDPRVIAELILREWAKHPIDHTFVVDVAGHRESKCPGIYDLTRRYVRLLLESLDSTLSED
jgi:hypothetical protein